MCRSNFPWDLGSGFGGGEVLVYQLDSLRGQRMHNTVPIDTSDLRTVNGLK